MCGCSGGRCCGLDVPQIVSVCDCARRSRC
ncbi:hypothetical protein [Salmonella phage SD-12_S18]|nr:hypothetical protein [Salmonella phage SD-12_S18]